MTGKLEHESDLQRLQAPASWTLTRSRPKTPKEAGDWFARTHAHLLTYGLPPSGARMVT